MAGITDLSNELLFNIVSHLNTGNKSEYATLLHLCHTSHRLCDIAQPVLYTSIVIAESRCLHSLQLLRETLEQRPSLAQKTNKLALFHNATAADEWTLLSQNVVLAKLSKSIGYPLESDSDLCYYALVMDILARLPTLQHLCFTATVDSPWVLLKRLEEVRRDNAVLPKLKTFHLHKKYEDGPVNIASYIPLMRHSSFQKFSSQNDVPDVPGQCSATNTLTHTAVELLWCLGPLATMKDLLDACRHLIHFKFVIPDGKRYKWMWDVAFSPLVTPRDLVDALLQTHGQSLQTLHLDLRTYYNFHDSELREEVGDLHNSIYAYSSFRGFASLSHMTIEFEKLASVSYLPESLEWLELRFCHFENLDRNYLADLVRLRQTWCPAIKSVTVSGWETDEGITVIREHVKSLNVRTSVSIDARVLEILEAGYRLVIQILAADQYLP